MLVVVLRRCCGQGDAWRAQESCVGSVEAFATLVVGSRFIVTARLALGWEVLFNRITYLLPDEFKPTSSSEESSLCGEGR